ncbi:MAG: MotA/TolQ/ExbB proton channel family protein [Pirellulaceae bacterium]|jgi:biopolymer transport protein ExbB|nr:MotA/TolQ/ExbB proton channel family protein [Pirellulaceae bacterium]
MRQGVLNSYRASVVFGLMILLVAGVFATDYLISGGSAFAADEAEAPAADVPADDAAVDDEAAEMQESYLVWFYKALGLKYVVVFLAISFTLVAFFVMNLLVSRRDNICPLHLVEAFEGHLNEKRYQEAYELAKADESLLGQVLASGLAKLSTGYDNALASMQETGQEESLKLDQRLSVLALVGTIAPMFGLLGTVDGMVASFQVIARSSTTPKPSELAQGISMALVTTLIGLWLAIPAILAFNLLKNRQQKLLLESGIISENLMKRFQGVSSGPKT